MRIFAVISSLFLLTSIAHADILGVYYAAGGSQPGFGTPVATRVDPNVNFDFGSGGPGIGGLGIDGFAVSWRGQVNIPNEGIWTFYTAADDGTRLWIDGQLVVNNWVDQGVNEFSGAKFLSAGWHDITVDYYEHGGGAACWVSYQGPGVGKQIIPQSALSLPRTGEQGILGRYAPMLNEAGDFGAVSGTRTDATINFDFETGPGIGGLGADQFGGRWTGKIFIPQTGNWTLTTNSDDGARLFIDSNDDGNYELIVNQWVLQGATDHSSPPMLLGAGFYNIAMEFFEWAGGEDARLKWTGPGVGGNSIIPASAYFTHNRGFITEFFNNTTLSGVPVVYRNDDEVFFNWGGAPQDRLPGDNFSARWRGKIQVPTTGNYTFFINSDDGCDLWVNGTRLVNRLGLPQAPTENSGSINLTAGVRYYIDLQYVELTGGATAELRWQGPGISKRVLSKDFVFPILNEAPNGITLNDNILFDNDAPNTVVGLLAAVDVDNTTGASPLQTHSFALVGGSGSGNNNLFTITNNVELRANSTLSAGTYNIRVRTTDNGTIPDSLTHEQAMTVVVQDKTPPSIALNGANPVTIHCGGSFVEPGYSATDNVNGNITANVVISGQTVNPAVVGSYVIRYDVSDAAGNAATQRVRTVNVVDITPPVITRIGAATINVQCGSPYNDPGATALDSCNGDLTGSIVTSGLPINTSTPNSFTVTYNVTDVQGNGATAVTRTVNVVDTLPPTITRNGAASVNVECGGTYIELGASALDACDPSVSVVIGGDVVDTDVPDTYTVTYNATDDNSNNATQVIRTVTVADTTAPAITLIGGDVVVQCGASFSDPGATASDVCDGSLTGSIVVGGDTVDTSTPDTYVLTYNVIDAAGNPAAQVTRTVEVQDTEGPVIALNGSTSISVLRFTPYNELGATATDSCEGAVSVTIGGDTVDTSAAANTSFTKTYNAEDSGGRDAIQVTRTVTIVAGIPPEITLNGPSEVTVECGATYTDQGAQALDQEDGDVTEDIVTDNPVDTATPGTYTVHYNVTDSNGNVASEVTRTVIVEDTTPPVLVRSGAATVTIECGGTFNDPGATATDLCDGPLTGDIVVGGDIVDTSEPGNYVITYNVADASDNAASEVTRTVTVADTTAPVITRNGPATVTVACGSSYVDAGATAVDACDGTLTSGILVSGLPVNTSNPGSYTVTYTVSDSANNPAAPVTRTVNVQDVTVPTIMLLGASVVTVNCGATYTDAGATASDSCDGNLTSSIVRTGLPIDTSDVGTHQITYNVSDREGNPAAQAIRTVVVQDNAVPVITVNGQATIVVNLGDTFTDPGAFALDTCEGTLPVVVGGDVVDTNTIGTYIITYDASDSTGNDAEQRTRTVIVTSGAPPIIIEHPGDANALFGDDATFSVAAAGLTQLSYQWKRNGLALTEGVKYSGVTTGTLTVNNVANADEGAFSVDVTASGSTLPSQLAQLTVADPGIQQHPESRVVAPGTTQQFTVVAAGTPTLSYQWRRNGQPLSNGGAYSGVATATLTITNVQEFTHEGDFTVVVSNGQDPAVTSNVAVLQVGNPAVTDHPDSIARNPGASASFTVVAVGNPPLVYQWQRNGENIANSGRISGAGSPTLTINNLVEADEADYRCRIVGENVVTSNAAILTVNDSPSISSVEVLPASGVISVNGTAAFTVLLDGGAAPLSYQWQRNNVNLNDGPRFSGVNTPTLTLINAIKNNSGTYRCIVTNDAGTATSDGKQLKVGLTITSNLFSSVAEVDSPFTWTVDVAGANGPLQFQWFKDDGSKAFVPLVNGGGISGVTTNTLVLNPVEYGDAGLYQVQVSDSIDVLSTNQAELSVVESLPAAGFAGLVGLCVAVAGAGAFVARRRKS